MDEACFAYCESPIGLVEIGGTPDGVTSLLFAERRRGAVASDALVEEAVKQVREYFLGSRREFDLPRAVRAVGAANGQNPISIIVPCHRIVGSDGRLVGYGGGLWRKEWLLRHEGRPTGKVTHGS
jgi:methylated-DNA-[protein]-cysteine S-methyltransferase